MSTFRFYGPRVQSEDGEAMSLFIDFTAQERRSVLTLATCFESYADGIETGRRADRMRMKTDRILKLGNRNFLWTRIIQHRWRYSKDGKIEPHPSAWTWGDNEGRGAFLTFFLYDELPSAPIARSIAAELRRIEPLLPKTRAGRRRRSKDGLVAHRFRSLTENTPKHTEQVDVLKERGFTDWEARKWVYETDW
ncbi:hypothetical protein FRD01_13625 [Microvenator marinus]|uniref:Uncharacterized protein n=1 Tax=Microvenator marinus TaxID=2600177 RepID=A0A5B8XVX4_9DELT|nr:hypothetical protein [Microvenator marinus]QED28253.1 hypothetical protein FRD01_13625 [Microvenator marinus]